MKIAFDYQIFAQQSYGGISRYYKNLAAQLLQLEQNILIFAGLHRNNYLSALPKDIVHGYKLSRYPPKTAILFQRANHYLTNYQMRLWRPEIIHETYYSNFTPQSNNVPRIVTAHDIIHELFSEGLDKSNIITQRKINAFNRADHIISVSHNTKKDLTEFFGISSEKISVIHLGSIDHASIINQYNSVTKYSRPFLLYVGPRAGYKNFLGFLKAVSQSQKLMNEFDIVTFGGGHLLSEELINIKSFGFKDGQVKQIGGNDSVLISLYQEAVAFIYPSLYEGFGIPPLEAMACRCPVISSNTSSMPEVIGDAGEYFDPKESESIKVAIEKVVFSQSRIKDLKTKGIERLKIFSWENCAKETLEIYKNAVG
jgi:glycosyltransferase involved in cell wall biosynthesis